MHTLLKKQSKTHPEIISILAMNIVALSEPISEYFEQRKDLSGIFNQLPVADLADWLEM